MAFMNSCFGESPRDEELRASLRKYIAERLAGGHDFPSFEDEELNAWAQEVKKEIENQSI